MSDQILILVANVDDALQKETTKKIQQWFFDKKIIKNEKAENIYGGDGFGFIPGDNANQFSDEDPDDYGMNDLTTNGVAFIEERKAFCDYSDIIAFKCSLCSAETRIEAPAEMKSFWYKVHCYDKGNLSYLNCPQCKTDQLIDQYNYMGQLAFGNIGIEFYNWPPISATCKSELEEVANSKIEVVFSHL